jgi:hypothetical protein
MSNQTFLGFGVSFASLPGTSAVGRAETCSAKIVHPGFSWGLSGAPAWAVRAEETRIRELVEKRTLGREASLYLLDFVES